MFCVFHTFAPDTLPPESLSLFILCYYLVWLFHAHHRSVLQTHGKVINLHIASVRFLKGGVLYIGASFSSTLLFFLANKPQREFCVLTAGWWRQRRQGNGDFLYGRVCRDSRDEGGQGVAGQRDLFCLGSIKRC